MRICQGATLLIAVFSLLMIAAGLITVNKNLVVIDQQLALIAANGKPPIIVNATVGLTDNTRKTLTDALNQKPEKRGKK